MSDKERYCSECGNPEYDDDGTYSHDYEPYDHDFELEDDGPSVKDVKDGLDILNKGLDFWNKLKQTNQSSQNLPYNNPSQMLVGTRTKAKSQKDHELHKKVSGIHESIELGKKIERKRWIIGLGISVAVAITIAFVF